MYVFTALACPGCTPVIEQLRNATCTSQGCACHTMLLQALANMCHPVSMTLENLMLADASMQIHPAIASLSTAKLSMCQRHRRQQSLTSSQSWTKPDVYQCFLASWGAGGGKEEGWGC